MRYSNESGNQIFVKGYEFTTFAKNTGEKHNLNKNLNVKYI